MEDELKSQELVMTRREFRERLNRDKVIYLLTMDNKKIKKLFWNEDEFDRDGIKWDWKTYITGVRNFLINIINDEEERSEFETNYKYATGRDYGRIYTRDFSIQSLQSRLRNFLITDNNGKSYYTDVDIQNCHFEILLGMVQDYNEIMGDEHKLEIQYIKQYVKKRKKLIKKLKFTKKEALILLNIDNVTQNKKVKNAFYLKLDGSQRSLFLMGLFNEIMCIKDRWLERDNLDPKYLKDLEGRKNPKSSFLNRMLCRREAEYLQKVIQYLLTKDKPRCLIPMFDGFLIEGEIDNKKLEKINKITQSEIKENHSIKWVIKPIIDDADIPCDMIEGVMDNSDLYIFKKAEYERTRCFIRKTGSYQIQYKDKDGSMTWVHYPKNQMEEDGVNQMCIPLEDSSNKSNMFTEWRKDKKRRQYEDIDFIPFNPIEDTKCSFKNIFNTFEGMNFKYDASYNEEPDKDLKEYLLNTLGGGNEEIYEFLYNVLAQIIQKPREKTGICVVLTGEEGVGKDTIIYLIRKLLGSNYVVSTNIMEDIVPKRGAFNMKLKDKLVVEFNETTGKDGNEYIEQLKDFITREKNDIRELYKAPYQQENMCRTFLFGNGLNPISMISGQRRFEWIKVPGDRKGDTDYWNKLYECFDNDEWIDKIGNELLHRDYGTYFKDKNYPVTDIMKQYYKLNMAKEVKFLWNEIVEESNWGNSSKIIENKNTGMVYIETNKLYDMFRDYCNKNSLNLTFDGRAWNASHFTKMILNYEGTEDNKMRCFKFKNGTTNKRMYGFNIDKLKASMMKKHDFNDDEEEVIELDGCCFINDDTEDELD